MRLKIGALVLVGAASASLGGCVGGQISELVPPPSDPNTKVQTSKGHFITFTTRALNSSASHIVDRSGQSSDVTVTQHLTNGTPTSADIEVTGSLAGGTVVSAVQGLPAVEGGFLRERKSDIGTSADAFLQITSGKSHGLYAYIRTTGDDPTIGGYAYTGVVAIGDKTSNMPTSGSATYRGQATAYLFPHTSGGETTRDQLRELSGTAALTASFNPGSASVSGRITDMKSKSTLTGVQAPFGADIVMNPAPMSGNSYQGGTLRLVRAGTNTAAGNVTSSDYQGSFFGDAAAETAGSFQFAATGVTVPGVGANQNVQAVGGFSGSR